MIKKNKNNDKAICEIPFCHSCNKATKENPT